MQLVFWYISLPWVSSKLSKPHSVYVSMKNRSSKFQSRAVVKGFTTRVHLQEESCRAAWNFIKILVAVCFVCVHVSGVDMRAFVCVCVLCHARIDFEMVKETIFNGAHQTHTNSFACSLFLSHFVALFTGSSYLQATKMHILMINSCIRWTLYRNWCIYLMGALPRKRTGRKREKQQHQFDSITCVLLAYFIFSSVILQINKSASEWIEQTECTLHSINEWSFISFLCQAQALRYVLSALRSRFKTVSAHRFISFHPKCNRNGECDRGD